MTDPNIIQAIEEQPRYKEMRLLINMYKLCNHRLATGILEAIKILESKKRIQKKKILEILEKAIKPEI